MRTVPKTLPPNRRVPPATGARLRRPRVLVVEDHGDSRALYSEYLRLSGWDVEEVTDGAHAMPQAASFHPDVIVMDISMRGLNGIEATRLLKAQGAETRAIPVVVLSAYVEKISDALGAGCDEFLPKPCAPSRLLDVLQKTMARARRPPAEVAKRERV